MNFTITRFSVLFLFLFLTVAGFSQNGSAPEDSPATAVGLYNDGLEKLKAKDYAAALPMLVEAIGKADTTSETDLKVVGLAKRNGAIAAYYVGTDQRKAEKIDDAIASFQLGIDYHPEFYANYIGLAQALDDKGEKIAAVTAYLNAAEVCGASDKTKDKVESMETKATNTVIRLFLDDKLDETLTAAEAFLAKKESSDVYCYQAKALLGKGKATDAVAAAEKAVGLINENSNADLCYFTKGEAHQAAGQKAEAIEAYKMAKGKYADAAKYKVDELEK